MKTALIDDGLSQHHVGTVRLVVQNGRVIFLEDGRVVGEGTYQSLLAKNERFRAQVAI